MGSAPSAARAAPSAAAPCVQVPHVFGRGTERATIRDHENHSYDRRSGYEYAYRDR